MRDSLPSSSAQTVAMRRAVAVDYVTMRPTVAGLARRRRSVRLVEGLPMYLSEPVVRAMFEQLAALAARGSRLAANFTIRGGGSLSPISRTVARIVRTTWR